MSAPPRARLYPTWRRAGRSRGTASNTGRTMRAHRRSREDDMAEGWHIAGEYLENCNCEVLCPCLLGPRSAMGALARPTEGHCDVPIVFQIRSGSYGNVDLAGTHAAISVYTPAAMGEGNWTFGLYVDAAAAPPQR